MRGKRITIFVGESDQLHHRPLYLAILEHLKAADCAGATVTRGTAGFGAHSQIKTATILRLSVDLPIVITAVDTPEKVDRLLPELSAMLSGGLITIDDTEIYFHSAAFRGGLPDVLVGDIMTKEPEAVTPETPIADVVEKLAARDYTALPVVDAAGHVVGVISDSDMLGAGLTRLSLSLHKVIGPDLIHEYTVGLKSEGKTVRDAMTAPAITVPPTTSIKEAAHLMRRYQLKRLPVVDESGGLVGILGRLDVFRAITAGYAARTVPREIRLPQEHSTVGQLMERGIVTVAAAAPLADVVGKLLATDQKRVLVVDDSGRLSGIVTDSDIVARVDPEERPGLATLLLSRWNKSAQRQVQRAYGQRAADVMTSPAVAIPETATVIEALTLTVERRVKRLPVVDSHGCPVGIVSRAALFAASLDFPTPPEAA